ncbi:MAG TPA: GNAT family N-acetyltransferase [Nocardioides sp.]|jgi:GNAT superfamily N-acetyltransferase
MPTEPPAIQLQLQLRRADADDANAIADLYTEARIHAVPLMPPALHTNAEDRAYVARQLQVPGVQMWIGQDDSGIVGFASITSTWLNALYVRPDRKGEGIGTALLDLTKSLLPDGFALWVFEANTPARKLYRRHGLIELEHTDGATNEERAPDLRMAWLGSDPRAFLDAQLAEAETEVAHATDRRDALRAAIDSLS